MGTLIRDGEGYSGNFTHYGRSRRAKLPEMIIPVSLPAAAVRSSLDALRPVRLLREVPPQYAPNYQAPRFTLVRRLAVSAPIGCAPGLFELAAESGTRAGARWDCVRYGGWAIDSVYARQSNPAWLTAGGVDAAWENLIDGMDLRRHLPRLPEGVAGWFMRKLD